MEFEPRWADRDALFDKLGLSYEAGVKINDDAPPEWPQHLPKDPGFER